MQSITIFDAEAQLFPFALGHKAHTSKFSFISLQALTTLVGLVINKLECVLRR